MNTPVRTIAIEPVRHLDIVARVIASALGKVSPIGGAGVFYLRGAAPVVGCWREGRSLIIRMGRVEVSADLKESKGAAFQAQA